MDKKVCLLNVIKSKILRTDFLCKLILCMALIISKLYFAVHYINLEYRGLGTEEPNIYMYLLMAFSDPSMAYYFVLIAFAILIADIVYEEYLTKNLFIKYGTRKNLYFGMLKLTLVFSFLFLFLFVLLAFIVGSCGGLSFSFEYTKEAILLLGEEQEFYILRTTAIYVPVSILKYNSLLILGIVIFKYYVGLVLLSMIGLVFSIKKDNVQYGICAILLTVLLNIAVLDYVGPWNFYKIGISIDLSEIFSYVTLQRFFIFDFAGIKKDVIMVFGDTMLTGAIWFVLLSAVIYRMIRKKDF